MPEPSASDAVKDARGTRSRAPGPPRLLTPEMEKKLTDYVTLHADRAKFEEQYPGKWLSSLQSVEQARQLLVRHQRDEDWRIREAERIHGTWDIDRQAQAQKELDSYNRGVNALKSSGVGAVVAAPVLGVVASQGADVHELANVAEFTTQTVDLGLGALALRHAAAPRAPRGGPAARSSKPSAATANKAVDDRGTAPQQKSVPVEPVVVPKAKPANDVTPSRLPQRGQVVPLPQPAQALQRTGTDDGRGGAPARASVSSGGSTRPPQIVQPSRATGPRPVPGAESRTPQTRRVEVSQPAVLARYQARAKEKMTQAANDVKARRRDSTKRRELAALREPFEAIMNQAGNASELTPKQREDANRILRRARPLARDDFGSFAPSVNGELRKDPEMQALERQLIRAGDAASGSGALRVRTVDTVTGAVRFEPLNVEHGTRLGDNPWRHDDPAHLMLTDAAQNQQFLEELRKHGSVWPNDRIEEFIIRHRLNEQGVDFSPVGTGQKRPPPREGR